jgi:hypothetical protein
MLKQRAQSTKATKSSPCAYAAPLNKCQPWHKRVMPILKTGQTGSTKFIFLFERVTQWHTKSHMQTQLQNGNDGILSLKGNAET